MTNPTRCFISFCVDEKNIDSVILLTEQLQRHTNNLIEFILYNDQSFGISLDQFIDDHLGKCDIILCLFGPRYKSRIDLNDRNSGVYKEFDRIVYRLMGHDKSSESLPPRLLPVIWAGDSVADSIPAPLNFTTPFAAELKDFRAHGIGTPSPFIPKNTLDYYEDSLKKISSTLVKYAEERSPHAITIRQHNFSNLLLPATEFSRSNDLSVREILQVKYEHGLYDAEQFYREFFTSTLFFRRLATKNVGLISGRKGAGKTTLVQIRELDAPDAEFFPAIDIEVESWNLHALIQNKIFKQADGDFEYIDTQSKFFDFVWYAFIAFAIFDSLNRENSEFDPEINTIIKSSQIAYRYQFIERSKKSTADCIDYAQLFELSVDAASLYIQKCVDQASTISEPMFRADMIRTAQVSLMLEYIFGLRMEDLYSLYWQRGGKKFIFCLDRFDDEVQKYRKENMSYGEAIRRERSRREIDWLSSLSSLVERSATQDTRARKSIEFQLFSNIKFLVVFPHDRAIEIRANRRDSIAAEPIEEIKWQPKELLTMLRKRIQSLYSVPDAALNREVNRTPEQRFYGCIRLACPKLPQRTFLRSGGADVEMDLFLYVLRHSFFRPRDILVYYAAILSYYESIVTRGREIEQEALREAISRETHTIINYEFVGELRDTWKNIEDILSLFHGAGQVLSFRDVDGILGSTPFLFYDADQTLRSTSERIHFLYEIGFLGFKNSRDGHARNANNDFEFSFFANRPPPKFSSPVFAKTIKFAIHPIFIEYLYLDNNSDSPVMPFTWDKLNRFDRLD